MQGIMNGKIYRNQEFVDNKVLLFDERIIDVIDLTDVHLYQLDQMIDAKGCYVLPGFIDLHIHGYASHDTMDDSDVALRLISERILENGVTSFLPTTMTMDQQDILRTLKKIKMLKENNPKGATILGVHLEGPFINAAYKGAQKADNIIDPTLALVDEFIDLIKIITIAPEINGALDFINEMVARGVGISLGHTGADYETAVKAYELGAKGITHIFNAMTGLHHRKPGVVGAALNKDFYCEIIADNFHLHRALYDIMLKIKKPENILLITDCTRATGMVDGEYELGGQKVSLCEGKCTLEDGTIAGSALKLNVALKNFVTSTHIALEKAVPFVTENPARYIGEHFERGSLCNGKFADVVIMDEHFEIYQTIKSGQVLYERSH